jgi:flagellar motor switch protein FliM
MTDAALERGAAAPWLREAKPDGSGLSIEKMPLLGAALEQFAISAGTGLASLCGVGVTATIDGIEPTTTFELLGVYQNYLAAVLHCASLDARLLLILDPQIVDFVLRSVFDAGPARDDMPSTPNLEERPRSELDSCLVGEFAKALTTMLREALAPSTGLDIAFEGLEELVDPQILGPRDMLAIGVKVTIKSAAGACVLIIALPKAVLGPVSQKLAKGAASGMMKPDPKWTRQMEYGVTQARITLTAILDEFESTLGDISMLAVGQVLNLTGEGQGQIRIECAERGVFHCKLGEQSDRYALEIEEIIAREPDAPISAAMP